MNLIRPVWRLTIHANLIWLKTGVNPWHWYLFMLRFLSCDIFRSKFVSNSCSFYEMKQQLIVWYNITIITSILKLKIIISTSSIGLLPPIYTSQRLSKHSSRKASALLTSKLLVRDHKFAWYRRNPWMESSSCDKWLIGQSEKNLRRTVAWHRCHPRLTCCLIFGSLSAVYSSEKSVTSCFGFRNIIILDISKLV